MSKSSRPKLAGLLRFKAWIDNATTRRQLVDFRSQSKRCSSRRPLLNFANGHVNVVWRVCQTGGFGIAYIF